MYSFYVLARQHSSVASHGEADALKPSPPYVRQLCKARAKQSAERSGGLPKGISNDPRRSGPSSDSHRREDTVVVRSMRAALWEGGHGLTRTTGGWQAQRTVLHGRGSNDQAHATHTTGPERTRGNAEA